MLTKHYISWWHASRLRDSTAHNQLNHGQILNPISTLIHESTNHLFNRAILVLCLTISLGMLSATKDSSCTYDTLQCFLKCSCEMSITIMQNHFRNAKEPNPIFEKQLSNFRSSELPFPRPGTKRDSLPSLSTMTIRALKPLTSGNSTMKFIVQYWTFPTELPRVTTVPVVAG